MFKSCRWFIQALVIYHLDYGNPMPYGLPSSTIYKLQRVQDIAEKVVLKYDRMDSARQPLFTLHWLTVKCRIMFKIACIMHRVMGGLAPLIHQEINCKKDTIENIKI